MLLRIDEFFYEMLISKLTSDTDKLYFSGVLAEFGLERFILGNTLFYTTFAFLSTVVIYEILIEKHNFLRTAIITCVFSTIALYYPDEPLTNILFFAFLFCLLLIRKSSASTLLYLTSYAVIAAMGTYFFTALPILKTVETVN